MTDTIIPEGARSASAFGPSPSAICPCRARSTQTGNKLDLALNGRGWFQVQGANSEILYTRAGAFNKNATGQLVTLDGNLVIPNITIPTDATDVVVNDTGQVYARHRRDRNAAALGQLTLANFANETGLAPLGGNLFQRNARIRKRRDRQSPATPASRRSSKAISKAPTSIPVKEITELISAQRAYEMNSKVIPAADDMYNVITKDIR